MKKFEGAWVGPRDMNTPLVPQLTSWLESQLQCPEQIPTGGFDTPQSRIVAIDGNNLVILYEQDYGLGLEEVWYFLEVNQAVLGLVRVLEALYRFGFREGTDKAEEAAVEAFRKLIRAQ